MLFNNNKLETVCAIIRDYCEDQESNRFRNIPNILKADTKLGLFGLKFDELDKLQLAIKLEEIYKIQISNDAIKNFRTIGDVHAVVVQLTKPKNLTRQQIYDDIIETIKKENPQTHNHKFSVKTIFREDLDLTSLDITEIIMNLCEKYGFEIEPNLSDIRTIGDVCNAFYIEQFSKNTKADMLNKTFQRQH